jgi:ubiquinol-cytochrome c reductase cytochrome b subunit
MLIAILILFILPIYPQSFIKSSKFDYLGQFFYWLFICDVILLGWLGSQLVEYPYVIISQISTLFYFLYFLFIIPMISYFEFKLLKY